jgi:branched-chain amino acid transport system ATP-binding protein
MTRAITTDHSETPATPAEHGPLLELSNVTAGYARTTVLRSVDIAVDRGRVVALLGANGAGKTTLLRVASGLLTPSAGTVALAGSDVTSKSTHARARAGLCLIPEGRGIFRNLTVRENLRLQVPPWKKNDDIGQALEAFPKLGDRLEQIAGTLSGGEQQMLALSRCFLADPSIVLLDEVSMGLAPRAVEEIFASLTRLTEMGISLLLVEQYVDRALDMADAVYLLDRGRIAFAGRPDELDRGAVLEGYLGSNGSNPSPDQTKSNSPHGGTPYGRSI